MEQGRERRRERERETVVSEVFCCLEKIAEVFCYMHKFCISCKYFICIVGENRIIDYYALHSPAKGKENNVYFPWNGT